MLLPLVDSLSSFLEQINDLETSLFLPKNLIPISPIKLLTSSIMMSVATSLAKALPKPTYTGEHEELPSQSTGARILGPGSLDGTQVVLKVSSRLPKLVAT